MHLPCGCGETQTWSNDARTCVERSNFISSIGFPECPRKSDILGQEPTRKTTIWERKRYQGVVC